MAWRCIYNLAITKWGGMLFLTHPHSLSGYAGVPACCKVSLSGVPEKSLIFGVDFGRFRGSFLEIFVEIN